MWSKENSNSDYQLEDKDDRSTSLTVAKCEKTLSIYVQHNLNFVKHIIISMHVTVNRGD